MYGAVGIWLGLNREATVVDNTLADLPYTGISMGFIWGPQSTPAQGNVIRKNRIDRVMQILSDGGAIYTLGNQPDSIIEENIITGVAHAAGRAESNGMFLDEGTTGVTIRNNILTSIAQSPLRFHRTGQNRVVDNQWELANDATPPVRFNNTPESNITVENNQRLPKKNRVYFIGNSLTNDLQLGSLETEVAWHIDCGKSLKFIYDHAEKPCETRSKTWPTALRSGQLDFVFVQPFYGTTLEQDTKIISEWMQMQPKATFVIHTGWAYSAKLKSEYETPLDDDNMTHHPKYFERLASNLQTQFKKQKILITPCTDILYEIAKDIDQGKSPFQDITALYRDPIHLNQRGKWLFHNAIRKLIGEPMADPFKDSKEFEIDPEMAKYLLKKLDR